MTIQKPIGRLGATDAPLSVAGVSVAVRDQELVAPFYRQALGLELLSQATDALQLGVGGAPLLELRHRPDLLPRDPAAAGLYHTAFLLPIRADLGRWLRHAAETGLTLDGTADHLVSEAVYLHDPEGNGIEVYADRPRSEWGWQDGQVVMANDRLDMIGLRALATERWDGAPEGTRVGHVHLQVGDTREAEHFYTGLLGLDVTRRWPQAVFLSSGGYHHHIAANIWHSAGAGRRDPGRAGLTGLVWRAADPETAARLAATAGVDPSGIPLRFISADPGVFA